MVIDGSKALNEIGKFVKISLSGINYPLLETEWLRWHNIGKKTRTAEIKF